MTDRQLILAYTTGPEPARDDVFAEIVRRHLDWVHSAAKRCVRGDEHLAADVAQAVFLLLSRKAAAMSPSVSLTGWLFNTTRLAARDALKLRTRRTRHESAAAAMRPTASPLASNIAEAEEQWAKMSAILESSLARLSPGDRDAVVLRFYRGMPHADVAEQLSLSESAAKKRVERALDKLREMFSREGVALPAAVIGATLAARATQAAPIALHASVAIGAAAPAVASLASSTAKLMLATKLKPIALVLLAVLAIAPPASWAIRSIGRSAPIAATQPATQSATNPAPVPRVIAPDPGVVPGGTTVGLRWFALLDARELPNLATLGRAEPTPANVLHLRRVKSDELLQVIGAAQSRGNVVDMESPIGWMADTSSRSGFFKTEITMSKAFDAGNKQFMTELGEGIDRHTLMGNLSGFYQFRPEKTGGVFVLDYHFMAPSSKQNAKLDFNGVVAAGESVMYVIDVPDNSRPMVMVNAIQAIQALPDVAKLMPALRSGKAWIAGGAGEAVKVAQAGADRSARAKLLPPMDAKWTHDFGDGMTVKLLGIGRPAKQPFVWWDGDGRPVACEADWATSTVSNGAKDLGVIVQYSRVRTKVQKGISGVTNFVPLETGKPVECGVPIGEWKSVGTIKPGEKLEADGVTYEFDKPESFHKNSPTPTKIPVRYNAPRDLAIFLQVVDVNGKIIFDNIGGGDWIPCTYQPNLILDRWTGMDFKTRPEQIDHIIVSTRPMKWHTFENFRTQPND